MSATGHAARSFPLSPAGASRGTSLWRRAEAALTDLTPVARFGVKGAGSAAWLAANGVALPPVNRLCEHDGLRILRLGTEDFVLLGEAAEHRLAAWVARWEGSAGARGYRSWREEGWAWLRVTGAGAGDVLARLCAIDLRPAHFASDAIAQTRVAGIEATLFRAQAVPGIELLFDVTVAQSMAGAGETAARDCEAYAAAGQAGGRVAS